MMFQLFKFLRHTGESRYPENNLLRLYSYIEIKVISFPRPYLLFPGLFCHFSNLFVIPTTFLSVPRRRESSIFNGFLDTGLRRYDDQGVAQSYRYFDFTTKYFFLYGI